MNMFLNVQLLRIKIHMSKYITHYWELEDMCADPQPLRIRRHMKKKSTTHKLYVEIQSWESFKKTHGFTWNIWGEIGGDKQLCPLSLS